MELHLQPYRTLILMMKKFEEFPFLSVSRNGLPPHSDTNTSVNLNYDVRTCKSLCRVYLHCREKNALNFVLVGATACCNPTSL